MFNRQFIWPDKRSFILLGPRQTGKSTLISANLDERSWSVNLLFTEQFIKYSQDPSIFRKEAVQKIKEDKVRMIFVDEIQRVPALLNEIQHLMSESKCQFVLTGSSARKLKRGQANLLAGRLAERHLFPLTYAEIGQVFDLEKTLQFGTLPPVVGKPKKEQIDILSSYAHLYLKEEIQSEGLSRNIGGFSRFLEIAASQAGELVSFSAVARECHLPVRTVQSYYEILEDTLLGFRLEPWHKSARKRLVAHPKFYFFDLGVVNAVNKRLTAPLDRQIRGRLFEQLIVLEVYRVAHYLGSEAGLFFWRTNHGAEVDLIIEKHGKIVGAYEIKSGSRIAGNDLSGLRAFQQEYPQASCAVICTTENAYYAGKIRVMPWQDFFNKLPELL